MADRYPLHQPTSPAPAAGLLSTRIAGSRYVFPQLAPVRGARWTLALAGREECRPDYVVDRAEYPFHVLEFVVAGRGRVRIGDGRLQRVEAGSVFACPASAPAYIVTDAEAPLVKFFFALHGADVGARLKEAGIPFGSVRHIGAMPEAVATAEELVREGQRHHPAAPAICLKLLEIFLLRFQAAAAGRNAGGDDRARATFLRCKALIDERAESLQTLEHIAAEVHLAPATICRLFRRFQGVSPYQYLTRRKMTLAAQLLLEQGALVKEAAARVGFSDPYHFSRCFRGVHGVPPATLRKLANSGS